MPLTWNTLNPNGGGLLLKQPVFEELRQAIDLFPRESPFNDLSDYFSRYGLLYEEIHRGILRNYVEYPFHNYHERYDEPDPSNYDYNVDGPYFNDGESPDVNMVLCNSVADMLQRFFGDSRWPRAEGKLLHAQDYHDMRTVLDALNDGGFYRFYRQLGTYEGFNCYFESISTDYFGSAQACKDYMFTTSDRNQMGNTVRRFLGQGGDLNPNPEKGIWGSLYRASDAWLPVYLGGRRGLRGLNATVATAFIYLNNTGETPYDHYTYEPLTFHAKVGGTDWASAVDCGVHTAGVPPYDDIFIPIPNPGAIFEDDWVTIHLRAVDPGDDWDDRETVSNWGTGPTDKENWQRRYSFRNVGFFLQFDRDFEGA